jgi:hypothetical protein
MGPSHVMCETSILTQSYSVRLTGKGKSARGKAGPVPGDQLPPYCHHTSTRSVSHSTSDLQGPSSPRSSKSGPMSLSTIPFLHNVHTHAHLGRQVHTQAHTQTHGVLAMCCLQWGSEESVSQVKVLI